MSLTELIDQFAKLASLEGNEPIRVSRMHFQEWHDYLEKLSEAIWPGLPKWTPSSKEPQQDFWFAMLESLRDKSDYETIVESILGAPLTQAGGLLMQAVTACVLKNFFNDDESLKAFVEQVIAHTRKTSTVR